MLHSLHQAVNSLKQYVMQAATITLNMAVVLQKH